MKILWSLDAWADYRFWLDNDAAMVARINALIDEAMRNPFRGLGKPEPLRGNLSGWWSRRISAEYRLIYKCAGSGAEQRIEVIQCRGHY